MWKIRRYLPLIVAVFNPSFTAVQTQFYPFHRAFSSPLYEDVHLVFCNDSSFQQIFQHFFFVSNDKNVVPFSSLWFLVVMTILLLWHVFESPDLCRGLSFIVFNHCNCLVYSKTLLGCEKKGSILLKCDHTNIRWSYDLLHCSRNTNKSKSILGFNIGHVLARLTTVEYELCTSYLRKHTIDFITFDASNSLFAFFMDLFENSFPLQWWSAILLQCISEQNSLFFR